MKKRRVLPWGGWLVEGVDALLGGERLEEGVHSLGVLGAEVLLVRHQARVLTNLVQPAREKES